MLRIRADGLQMASRRLKNARKSGLRAYTRSLSFEQPRSNYLKAFSLILSYECFAVSQNTSYEHILCCILSYECFAHHKSQSSISGLSQPEALVARALSVLNQPPF